MFYKGRALADLVKVTESVKTLLQAENFFKKKFPNDIETILSIDLGLSDCYVYMKQTELAIMRLQNVEKTGLVNDIPILQLKIYDSYAQIYTAKRDYKKVIENYDKYLSSYKSAYPHNYEKSQQYNHTSGLKEMLKVSLAAKKANYEGEYSGAWIKYSLENGSGGLMDQLFSSYLVSELPDPKQQDLSDITNNTTKIEVFTYEQGAEVEGGGHSMVKKVQKEIIGLELKELLSCFEIKEDKFSHLMSVGKFHFTFFSENNVLGEIEYLGDGVIRWSKKWKEDATLINKSKMENTLKKLNLK